MGTRLDGLVVVTGGGSGIGRATAERFASGGATVIVADIDGDAAGETAALINAVGRSASGGGPGAAHPPRAHAYVLDVADAGAWVSFAEQIMAEHGVPDVLVNNAGFALFGAFLDQTAEDWERIVGVNLMGVVHGCRVIGWMMADRGAGHIVNIASAAAWIPTSVMPSYSVTKAAVLMLSECLRMDFAGRGVGVTAICPTVIRTNIAANAVHAALSDEEAARRNGIAAGGMGLWPIGPDKVARAIVRSVRRNIAILPVNPDAWLTWGLYRLSPTAARTLARVASPERSEAALSLLARLPGVRIEEVVND